MIESVIGIALGLTIGFGCRWFDIPLPAPPKMVGALLVVAMTVGFVGMDFVLVDKPASHAPLDRGLHNE